MEQSEGFKSVALQIKSLEQELSLCDEAIKDVEQSGKDVEKEIEEHFARCMNSLAARKEVLFERGVSENRQSTYDPSPFNKVDIYFLM
jgi:hypothetical protein